MIVIVLTLGDRTKFIRYVANLRTLTLSHFDTALDRARLKCESQFAWLNLTTAKFTLHY
jgi:hypothetical protein